MKAKPLFIVLAVGIILIFGVFMIFSQSTQMLSEKEAIDVVLVKYPELAVYQTTDLPPSSIESKQSPDGWYLGFIRRGSGIPGIIDAKCYFVNSNKSLTVVGEYRQNSAVADAITLSTCEPVVENLEPAPALPNKSGVLKLGELGIFEAISIRPLSIEEDSRCPVDVTCIQAGTVRVKIQVISRTDNRVDTSSIVKLGQEFTTEGVSITLTSVTPVKNSKINTLDSEYRFYFTVTKQDVPIATDPKSKCYIGGCSGQICSDRPDMASTCEYREEYACYKSAVCERQSSGECGFTPSPTLSTCLQNS